MIHNDIDASIQEVKDFKSVFHNYLCYTENLKDKKKYSQCECRPKIIIIIIKLDRKLIYSLRIFIRVLLK